MDKDALFKLYKKSYFAGEEYKDYVADREVLRKNFALRYRTLCKYLNPARHRNLLEIGSAYGFFLELVKKDFLTATGIDVTEEGVQYARDQLQLDVVQGDFLDVDFAGRIFDVVCMWDTIEHLCDPHLYLEKIKKLTATGAILALTTGDIASITAKMRQDKWRLIHPPTHVHYFSGETITKLLNDCGFDVLYNKYCGFYRTNDNVLHNILVLRQKKLWLYDFFKKMGITRFAFYLNLFDIMYVIARKR